MRHFSLVRNRLKRNDETKEPSSLEISEVVAQLYEQLWYKSSIPVIGRKRVAEKVRTHHEKRRTLLKPICEKAIRNIKVSLNHLVVRQVVNSLI